MHDRFPGPLSSEVREDPYPCYRWLLNERPVYHDDKAGYWALSRYEDVMAAARNHADFSSAQGIGLMRNKGRTLLSTDPPDHDRLRKLVTPAFSPGVIDTFAPRIEVICNELIDASAVARGSFDLIEDFAFPLPVMVISEIMGLDPARREDYRRWSRSFIAMISNPGSLNASWLYSRTGKEFFSYLFEVMAARRSAPRNDLISLLIQARDERDALSEAEIVSACELFLTAGNETTTGLIGNAALALGAHPGEAKQVFDDPALIPSMIEEVIRYDGPVQADFRTTTKPVTIHGILLPAEAKVALLWAAANRDPLAFPDADCFRVRRSPNPHLGFGYGIHRCVGAPLARLQARIAATVLLRRFSRLAPSPTALIERNLVSPLFRGLRHLPMSFLLN